MFHIIDLPILFLVMLHEWVCFVQGWVKWFMLWLISLLVHICNSTVQEKGVYLWLVDSLMCICRSRFVGTLSKKRYICIKWLEMKIEIKTNYKIPLTEWGWGDPKATPATYHDQSIPWFPIWSPEKAGSSRDDNFKCWCVYPNQIDGSDLSITKRLTQGTKHRTKNKEVYCQVIFS